MTHTIATGVSAMASNSPSVLVRAYLIYSKDEERKQKPIVKQSSISV